MGNSERGTERVKIQEHRRKAGTSKCGILHYKNRVPTEKSARRLSKMENSIQLLQKSLSERYVGKNTASIGEKSTVGKWKKGRANICADRFSECENGVGKRKPWI